VLGPSRSPNCQIALGNPLPGTTHTIPVMDENGCVVERGQLTNLFVGVYMTKSIHHHDELELDYGTHFWKDFQNYCVWCFLKLSVSDLISNIPRNFEHEVWFNGNKKQTSLTYFFFVGSHSSCQQPRPNTKRGWWR
jgi:hypothetical protein